MSRSKFEPMPDRVRKFNRYALVLACASLIGIAYLAYLLTSFREYKLGFDWKPDLIISLGLLAMFVVLCRAAAIRTFWK